MFFHFFASLKTYTYMLTYWILRFFLLTNMWITINILKTFINIYIYFLFLFFCKLISKICCKVFNILSEKLKYYFSIYDERHKQIINFMNSMKCIQWNYTYCKVLQFIDFNSNYKIIGISMNNKTNNKKKTITKTNMDVVDFGHQYMLAYCLGNLLSLII